MKAVVLEKKGVINVRDVPDAGKPGPGELKIAPHSVGICGSDVHYYTHGRVGKYIVEKPMILGHEASGTVLEVGPGVKGFKPGDRIAMEPGIPDMNSRATKLGLYNIDPSVRFFATPPVDGCLCDEVIHPAAFTYKLPDNMSYEEGALLEPLSVGLWAATKATIKPGDIGVVTGAGTVGMLTAACALAGGCSKVLISDTSAVKLDIASKIPGIIPVDITEEDLLERVKEETGGWGADRAFEASGNVRSYDNFWKLGAPGNTSVIIGIPADGKVPMDITEVQARETRIENVFRYANVYQKAIDLVSAGKINLKPFISKVYPMDEAKDAFDRVVEAHPEDVKIQIQVTK
ncbi:NAD(P)-dependent alcohol dehydrogenase [Bifidobacterium sp. ESL0784]|uniref:NAD(P)-dependent alcohol dehydrogenase n=1 Tax=Bifidobacterium sp. ESL0784 TaxID=2983231 RepID=UPI0023F97E58|nr:NAD(P)-dependent alcohol dehydrogenase [Bifidobacterium sp. ESL0784]MDF7640059.1 NAD(P)-dependent alcohol dehydrogenase [Bifidobacterium sp. ESL0784]